MTAAIDDVGALPGRKVHDQERQAIGKVAHVYAIDGDGEPMWIGIKASFGLFDKREILVPLARLKEEDGELLVPYSIDHIRRAPEIESDEIDEQADRRLRDHFGIDSADQELRDDNHSYATLVTEQTGVARRVEDPESLESPNPDKRTDETYERLNDVGSAETRDVDAGQIANELTSNQAHSGDERPRATTIPPVRTIAATPARPTSPRAGTTANASAAAEPERFRTATAPRTGGGSGPGVGVRHGRRERRGAPLRRRRIHPHDLPAVAVEVKEAARVHEAEVLGVVRLGAARRERGGADRVDLIAG